MYYVYILTNFHNTTLYVGMTNDLARRMYEHKNEVNEEFTKLYQIHKLVYYECFLRVNDAIMREKQIKKLSRKNKDKLIGNTNPSWQELPVQ